MRDNRPMTNSRPRVKFGELVILEARQIEPASDPNSADRYLVFDKNTKRVVFFAPLTAEGLEQARSVKKAQEEKRSDRDAVRT